MTVIGFITAISFGYIGYIAYSDPAVTSTTNNAFAFELLGSVIVIGLVVSFISKYHYKSEGVDISLAFKEIPPE